MKTAMRYIVMLLTVICFAGPVLSQRSFPMQIANDLHLLFETIRESLVKKKVAQMTFSTIPDTMYYPDKTYNIYQGIDLYMITRNGQPGYMTYIMKQAVIDSNAPITEPDTTYFGPGCRERYHCDCFKGWDSIACNEQGNIIYASHLSKYRYFIYDDGGRLKEQRFLNAYPDGSNWYKDFYRYNASGRLVAIESGVPGTVLDKNKPITNIFDDYSFPILSKTTFEYNASGQLTQVINFSKNEKTGRFVYESRRTYIYKNGLPTRVNYYETDPNKVISFEKVGYTFY